MPKHIHTIAALAIVALFSVLGFGASELHKARLEQAATRERVDTLIGVERDLITTVNPKAQHVVCKATPTHPEIDLGVPHECADGQCITWKGQELNLQAAGARCEHGTL